MKGWKKSFLWTLLAVAVVLVQACHRGYGCPY